jgi:hypothetical protein
VAAKDAGCSPRHRPRLGMKERQVRAVINKLIAEREKPN